MAHHHKSNREVEGNPDFGHGRGLPLRPDVEELERRTDEDRREAGLPVRTEDPWAEYEAVHTEINREVGLGEIQSQISRKGRPPFPPTRYES
ncbi:MULTISPECIES: hypothetical protein [Streptomyces]|uniref:Uncharacterized protein n=1 Tax=Streptomyces dengpaensis TaxID=2049881 RepID=A0ABM6SJW7_9ACTN|nr:MULTISPECIES: hypothetical protein [Streptomyces]AVH54863.1 hypothetical protein C4B68_02575 [Streptomyces dengpaensis]PIB03283.1 hypothetical protein B1C81_37495 [Streptomyces sp. HG99]